MKQHNLLLLAYMVFSGICLVLRSFGEYESWGYVVSSVAVSSAILAYADFFYVHSKFYSDSCDMAEKFISDRSKKIVEEKSIVEDICVKMDELKSKGIAEVQEEKNIEIAKHGVGEFEKYMLDFEGNVAKKRKKQKKFSVIADILTFSAFLSFLCLLTFYNIAQMMEKIQDIISVIAFIVILSSQYITSVFAEERKKEIKRHNHAVEALDATHQYIFEMKNRFNTFYEKVQE